MRRTGALFLLAGCLLAAGAHILSGAGVGPPGPVTSVPGFSGKFPSAHEAGYIPVGGGRELFYYFAECEDAKLAPTAPVLLWLNGGPGCSSFDGFIYEHGPFSFSWAGGAPGAGVELSLNPHSWSKVAHVLYVDSPAGVGYSYAPPGDVERNDTQTAQDSNAFLRKWFKAHPSFAKHEFYVSGESYAGIYVPTLTAEVARGNDAGQLPYINVKGYLVGNGCTDEVVDGNAYIPFAFGKSLIGLDVYERGAKACKNSYWNATGACAKHVDDMQTLLDDLNVYDTLDVCYHPDGPGAGHALLRAAASEASRRAGGAGRSWPVGPVRAGKVDSWRSLGVAPDPDGGVAVPCMDSRLAHSWLNLPETRVSLHAAPAATAGEWAICSDEIEYTHDYGSMLPVHAELNERGLRALVYSGDHDLSVPHTGSERWTRDWSSAGGPPLLEEWRAWMVNDQVAGYVRHYEKLTYATVKGAGHTVPQYKPVESLAMLTRFLHGAPL